MLRLFTSWYPESDPVRRQELVDCLTANLGSGLFDEVCILLEQCDPPVTDARLRYRAISHRPNYSDFIDWANTLAHDHDDLIAIANSDIFFDATIVSMLSEIDAQTCAALSRWEISPSSGKARLFDRSDSQDSWVFRGPIKEIGAAFAVGVPRCDNRFLYELGAAGYNVINPARSIRTFHLHSGERKEYSGTNLRHFVDPPYAYLWPHNLWSPLQTLNHNLRNPGQRVGWSPDLRRYAATIRRFPRKLIPARATR